MLHKCYAFIINVFIPYKVKANVIFLYYLISEGKKLLIIQIWGRLFFLSLLYVSRGNLRKSFDRQFCQEISKLRSKSQVGNFGALGGSRWGLTAESHTGWQFLEI